MVVTGCRHPQSWAGSAWWGSRPSFTRGPFPSHFLRFLRKESKWLTDLEKMPLNWQISRLYTRKENCKPWNCVFKEVLHSSIHGLSTPGLAIIKSRVPIAFLSHPGCTNIPLPIWENLNGTIQQRRKHERCSAQPRAPPDNYSWDVWANEKLFLSLQRLRCAAVSEAALLASLLVSLTSIYLFLGMLEVAAFTQLMLLMCFSPLLFSEHSSEGAY